MVKNNLTRGQNEPINEPENNLFLERNDSNAEMAVSVEKFAEAC